jgi:hypothetical protein
MPKFSFREGLYIKEQLRMSEMPASLVIIT